MPKLRRLALVLAAPLLLALVAAPEALAHGLLTSRPAGGGPTPSARTPGAPVVLASHRVEAKIDGPVAEVTLEQVFRNRTGVQLEGTYLFPLPEGAAVSGFAMTLGGKMVVGEVLEADEARRIYEGIVRQRRDPGLLEYVGRGLFRAKVFPIEPRGEVTIRLVFQQILPDNDGTLEFRYPLATDRLHSAPVEETVLTVDVKSDVDIKAVYSPSHEVAVVRKGDREVHASYEKMHGQQERDFLLHIGRSPDRVGLTLLSHKAAGEDGYFLALLAPKVDRGDLPVVPKDVVFVLDTSGSMGQDGKIDQAKRALAFGVGVLRPEDRFSILSFSSQVRSFREAMSPASAEIKQAATNWITGLQASGGTYIEQALATALRMGTPGRLLLVVFLTDGRPTVGERNADKLVAMVKRDNASNARVFTFGVGFDLDVHLLDRVAEVTRGARDYVMPREELEITTSRFFRKVVEPALTDVSIDFGGVTHDVYPSEISDLFAGGQVVLMGRYPEGGKRTLRLRGKIADKEIEYVYETELQVAERAPWLPRLWAQRKVAFLVDQIRLHGEEKELVDEVRRLGIRYALVTPYTAGLVTTDEELQRAGRGRRGPPPPTAPPPAASPRSGPRYNGGGHGGQYRGPGDSVPPGLREPSDPSPAPPPPPSGPPTTPTPGMPAPTTPRPNTPKSEAERSKELAREKERASARSGAHVRVVEGKTFRRDKDGRWVDTAWNGKQETVKVEAFSEAWTKLVAEGEKVVKYLALGDRVVFVLGDKVYEVVPPEGAAGEKESAPSR